MYKSKLAIFIDSIIYTVIILLLSYSWLNKLLKTAFLSLFIANIISLLLFTCIYLHFTKYHKQSKLSANEAKLFNNTLESLKYSSLKNQSKYFCDLLNATFLNEKFYLNDKYYFYININTTLSANDFYTINNFNLSKNSNKELIILSLSADEDFNNLFNNSPIKFTLFLKDDIFEIIKLSNSFISQTAERLPLSTRLKKLIYSLPSIKFKNLFFPGASLVILSFFIPYSILYLITGSLLLILSAISLFSKNKQPLNHKQVSITDVIKK